MVLIVSRRRLSEVESSTVPENTKTFPVNFPERQGVGSNEFDTGPGLVCDAEVFFVGDVLECPKVVFILGYNPL